MPVLEFRLPLTVRPALPLASLSCPARTPAVRSGRRALRCAAARAACASASETSALAISGRALRARDSRVFRSPEGVRLGRLPKPLRSPGSARGRPSTRVSCAAARFTPRAAFSRAAWADSSADCRSSTASAVIRFWARCSSATARRRMLRASCASVRVTPVTALRAPANACTAWMVSVARLLRRSTAAAASARSALRTASRAGDHGSTFSEAPMFSVALPCHSPVAQGTFVRLLSAPTFRLRPARVRALSRASCAAR
ncbi:hypothetical protein DEMA109039_15475 [Deinococcus marmoris]